MEKVEDEEGAASRPSSSRLSRPALFGCVALLILYTALSWSARAHKSPTYDEPYHALAGWMELRHHDFRVDAADPPLWQLYAALADGPTAIAFDSRSPNWFQMPQRQWLQWIWCVTTLYRTPGNDPATFIARQQAMMLPLAAMLGALVAVWAGRVGGAAAAVVAVTLFTFDPNLLGYGPLVKNDVVFSLAFAALCYALWRLGDRLTLWGAAAVAGACAAMVTIKFSGVITGVLVPMLLLLRALSPRNWGPFSTRAKRIMVVFPIVVFCAAASVLAIWAVYGFRFGPSPDPTVRIDTGFYASMAKINEYAARHDGNPPADSDANTLKPSSTERLLLWAESHRLLPQAWLAGLLFTYQSALVRQAYLLGRLSNTGWWYYFPAAMAVKTPVATIGAVSAAAAIGAVLRRRNSAKTHWAAVCVIAPIALYMASAVRSNLNIGIRHVLPVYPLMFVGVGCVAAVCLRRWRRGTITALVILGVCLAAESLSAYPDYIAFFNRPAGGSRGGIRLLGDSNLDWGQDLPSLVAWQRDHPERPLYLAYFGLPDPKWFGVRYTPLPGGYAYDPPPSWPRGNCTVAVSATYLQGILVDPRLYAAFYSRLATRPPTAVLGGTIYLFDLDAR